MAGARLTLTTAFFLLGAWLFAQGQSDRPGVLPSDAEEIPLDEGVIRGRVVDARSGRPIGGAVIAVAYDGQAAVRSDSDGRYEIAGLEPGDVHVFVRANGYVAGEYGQREPTDPGAAIFVRGGQATTGVRVELHRVGSISGHVYDETGEGRAGVEVQALRETYLPGGPRWVPVAFAQTDASGLYQVANVFPGAYRVMAFLGRPPRSSGPDTSTIYAPTFFVSTTRLEEARSILVAPGQDAFGVDIAQLVSEAFTLSGIVTDPTGEPFSGVMIALLPGSQDGSRPVGQPQPVADDGRFTFTDIVPGNYRLLAHRAGYPTAMFPVLIEDDDLTDVEVVFRPGTRLDGRILTDGRRPVPFDPTRLRVGLLHPIPGDTDFTGPGSLTFSDSDGVRSDGTFSLEHVVGPTQLRISNLPDGWSLKTVRLDGADVTDDTLDFGDGVSRELDLVLTDQTTHVAGRVTDRLGKAVTQYTVVVFPRETDQWIGSSRRVHGAGPDHDGVYRLQRLPAGDYLAIAVDSLPRYAWFDSRVLEQLWPRATSFRLDDGEFQTLNLKLSTTPIFLRYAR